MRTNRNFPGLVMNFPKVLDDLLSANHPSDFSDFVRDFNAPKYNVKENDENYMVEMAVPGFEKNDFNIEVHEGKLTISSELEEKNESEKDGYSYREFKKESFSRSFALPKNKVDEEKVNAAYNNGVLTVTLAKKEEAKPKAPKHIEIV